MPEPVATYYDIRFTIIETYCQSIFDTFKTISWALGSKVQNVFGLLWRNLSAHDLAWGDSAEFKGDESSRTNLNTWSIYLHLSSKKRINFDTADIWEL